MPAQRAQALAQLGNIGPNIDMQLQRAVAVRNQQEALRRQNELFPLQRQQLQGQITAQQNQAALFPLQQQQIEGGLAAQRQQLAMQQRQAAMEIANLTRQIQTMEGMGLDASGVRQQLQIAQQYAGGTAGGAGAPAPTGSSPAVAAGASMAPGAAAPSPAPAPSAAPYEPSQTVSDAGYGGAAGQQASMGFQRVLSQLPYLSPDVVRSSLAQGGDLTKTMADLYKENEKAKQEAFKNEAAIQKEYRPRAETFANQQISLRSMMNLARDDSGASDVMLITQLYKLFDEGSVVSVTETGQIKSTTPLPERVQSLVDSFKKGTVLTEDQRQRIIDAGMSKFTESYRKYNTDFEQQTKNAVRQGLDASAAVPDVREPEISKLMDLITKKNMAPVLKGIEIDGAKYDARLGIDGKYYVKDPTSGRMRPVNIGQRRPDEEQQ
jgi:cyclophilin family peptidyl-prolyl cis-trans isomerase